MCFSFSRQFSWLIQLLCMSFHSQIASFVSSCFFLLVNRRGRIVVFMATKSAITVLKHFSLPYKASYCPSIHKLSTLSSQPFFSGTQADDNDIAKVLSIINSSCSSTELRRSLQSSGVTISNDLVDRVLKRARFSHCNPLQALEFFNFIGRLRGFIHTSYSLDTMLYILGRNRKFNLIWDVLIEIKVKDRSLISVRTVNIVLSRVAKVCSVRQTVETFKKFRKLVMEFDTNCFNALLRALCQEKSMTDARNVYHSLKFDFKPNLQTFNTLLSGWKSLEEVETFFDEMREMGINPDIVSYNCLIDVYSKGRHVDKVYQVFDKMRDENITPDVISYTSLIGGLGLIGQPDKARAVLHEMKEYGCYPDVAAYNAVVRNFCIAKRIGDAYSVMDEMVEKGLKPNAVTYNVFLRSFYWFNDLTSSWSLYMRMKETMCLPNTQSCMFLMKLLKRHEKVGMAVEVWNDMVEMGFGSYSLVSDVLLDFLCDMGKLVEAEKCLLQMVAKGQRPSGVSFKRVKVLMELANKRENLERLTEVMANAFGPPFKVIELEEEKDPLEKSVCSHLSK